MTDLATTRMQNQRITGVPADSPGDAVAWMGPMQAQHHDMAKWAIGLRSAANQAAVDDAIARGDMIRTWLLRGTLHFVAAADARWILALVGPRIVAGSKGRHRQLGLDDATLERSRHTFVEALHGQGQLTRQEMLDALEAAGISTEGQRGYHMLGYAGLMGDICFGPMQGRQETFELLDEIAPSGPVLAGDDALAELAVRYFQSHGPAALQDFVWWSGLRVRDARIAIQSAGDRLVEQVIAGEAHWSGADAVPRAKSAPIAHLLPAFDEAYLGYRDRSAVLDPAYDSRVVSSNGIFRPMVVIGGQVVGIWKQATKSGAVSVTPELFRDLDADERSALEDAARRYAAYLGMPVTLA